jgi:uncharacterized protein
VTPVKALRLVQVDEVLLEPFGVRQNRAFHLIDDRGVLVNDKRHVRLSQVEAAYDEAAATLELRFPDGTAVAGEIELGEPVATDFWGRPVPGRLVHGPWAEALSSYTGKPLRLVRPDEPGAGVDRGLRGAVSLVSRSSLDALARAAGIDGAVDFRRFRMLIGLEGTSEHEEDAWLGRRVRLGDAVVVPRGNVGRCAITTQNPDTGDRDLDTLRVLKEYRGDVETTEPLPFGVFAEVAEPGRVRVGDAVSVG